MKLSMKAVTPLQISQEILEEIKGTITEGIFHHRWTLIETYHNVGKILAEHESEMPKNYIQLLAKELNQSDRLIYQCRQFYKKYPRLDTLPMGKNVSWHKIANNLLPVPKENKLSPEERLLEMIDLFLKVKSIDPKNRAVAKQIVEEWENFKTENKAAKKK